MGFHKILRPSLNGLSRNHFFDLFRRIEPLLRSGALWTRNNIERGWVDSLSRKNNWKRETGGAEEATDGKRDPVRIGREEQSEERFHFAIQPLVSCGSPQKIISKR